MSGGKQAGCEQASTRGESPAHYGNALRLSFRLFSRSCHHPRGLEMQLPRPLTKPPVVIESSPPSAAACHQTLLMAATQQGAFRAKKIKGG